MISVMRIHVRMVNGASPEIRQITRELAVMSKAVQASTRAMAAQSAKTGAAVNRLSASTTRAAASQNAWNSSMRMGMSNLTKFGKNIQWTGRQIEYNFTLPLALATGYITKMALDQEAAATRIAKVYGDQTAAIQYWKNQGLSATEAMTKANQVFDSELAALDKTFTALSNKFGVAKTSVQEIAGEWAAAGASGRTLAEVVSLTMEAMVLGEFEAGEATKALMSIQAQYGADTKGLMKILQSLNAVENATGANMNDLILAFSRSAGAARTAGVDYKQLAAYTAALVPAAGSATNAGNALKTMFSRILAPTGDAAKIMNQLGAETDTVGWVSMDVAERLAFLGEAMEGATQQQKAVVSTYVASRYQVNRFDVLIRELTSDTGYYAKALDAVSSKSKIAATYQREMTKALNSQPRQFAILRETMKNTLVDAIIPFIPAILWLMDKIVALAKAFGNLSPELQLLIVSVLVGIAAVGTLTRVFGALILLVTTLGGPLVALAKGFFLIPMAVGAIVGPVGAGMARVGAIVFKSMRLITLLIIGTGPVIVGGWAAITTAMVGIWSKGTRALAAIWVLFSRKIVTTMLKIAPALLGPWGIAFAAMGLIIWTFRDEVGEMIRSVINYFGQLPSSIASIFQSVIRVIASAIKIVIDWLSYLNPFQRHSPSLVDNVTAGVAEIARQYASLRGIGAVYRQAARDLAAFNKATAGTMRAEVRRERNQDRKVIRKVDGAAGVGQYNKMLGSLRKLDSAMAKVSAQYEKQARVVARWERAIEQANRAIERQEDILQGLQDAADAVADALSAAQDRLSGFMDAPLVGERAMRQAILDNEIAQARLQQQMMEMEDTFGPIDGVRNRLALLQGQIELVNGAQAGLRAGGAGSEILGVYDQQVSALQDQQSAIEDQLEAYDELQGSIEDLDRAARRLDLEQFLNFDAVHQQIELLTDTTAELTSEQIIAGIRSSQAEVKALEAAYESATAAVDAQQAVIDSMIESRDELMDIYDRENEALQALGDTYDAMADRYNEMESALQAFVGAAQSALDAAEAAAAAKDEKKDGAAALAGGKPPKPPALSPAEQAFVDGGKGNFDDAGLGDGLPIRKNYEADLKGIDDVTKGILDSTRKAFGDLDVFGPLKDMWKDAVAWLKDNTPQGLQDFVGTLSAKLDEILIGAGLGAIIGGMIGGPVGAYIGAAIGAGIGMIIPDGGWGKVVDTFTSAAEGIGNAFMTYIGKPIAAVATFLWEIMGPELSDFGNMVMGFFGDIGSKISEAWKGAGLGNIDFGAAIETVKNFFGWLAPFFKIALVPLVAGWKILANIFNETLKPMLDGAAKIFGGIFDIIFNVVGFIVNLLGGDLVGAADSFMGILDGIGNIIVGLFQGLLGPVLGPVKGIAQGIVRFFMWLWDELKDIVPDIVGGVIAAFKMLASIGKWIWDNVLAPIFGFFVAAWDLIKPAIDLWWEKFKTSLGLLIGAGLWIWDNVLKPIAAFFVAVWDNMIQPAVALWWESFKSGLALMVGAGVWIWDNVLKPVVDFFVDAWDDWIKPALALWWDGIKNIWSNLKNLGKWMWENVLKPVFDKVEALWKDFVKPALAMWWDGIKTIWNILKTLAVWLWDNVLKPAYERIKSLWTTVKPELAEWWDRIKSVWDMLKGLAMWVWDNVLKPVFEKAKELWTTVKGELGEWWGRVKDVWEKLKELGNWIKTEVMDPIFDAFKKGWEKVKEWLAGAKDLLTSPVKAIVNTVIDAVNAIVKGLNKIGELLPGVEWDIPLVARLATGGEIPTRHVGGGFKTKGARAIVGEGKANHPEFVIPTDPTHRNRARSLLNMAANQLGVQTDVASSGRTGNSRQRDSHGVPMYSIGGWIGDRWDDAQDLAQQIRDLPSKAVGKVMDVILDTAETGIKQIGWAPAEIPPRYIINKLRDWVTETDSSIEDGHKMYALPPSGGDVSVPYVPGGITTWKGGTFTPNFIAHMKAAEELAGVGINVIQGGFRPATDYSGTSHAGDAVDFQVSGALITALRRVGIAAGDRTGLGDWSPHSHAVPGPGAGIAAGSAVWQFQDYMAKGGMNQPLNSPWGLANGGIVPRTPGGTLARIGEGSSDEVVLPLPSGWRRGESGPLSSGGETNTVNINGNLSFPNITDPNDADMFIRNLKTLAKD